MHVWPSLTPSPQHVMDVWDNAGVSGLLEAAFRAGEEAALGPWSRALAAGIKCEAYGHYSQSRALFPEIQ